MRSAPASIRVAAAFLLLLLLAVRALAPAGFMPAFDRGALTIVACPDFAPASAHHHGPGEQKKSRLPCPYGAAGSAAGVEPAVALLVALLFFPPLLSGSRPVPLFGQAKRERPPSRGPPLPA